MCLRGIGSANHGPLKGGNTYMYPFIGCLVIPAEDSEVVVGCPCFMRDCEENGFIHRINARYPGLEFITMFEAGYPDFNICKD